MMLNRTTRRKKKTLSISAVEQDLVSAIGTDFTWSCVMTPEATLESLPATLLTPCLTLSFTSSRSGACKKGLPNKGQFFQTLLASQVNTDLTDLECQTHLQARRPGVVGHLIPAVVVGRRDGRRAGEPAKVGITAAVAAVTTATASRS